MANYSDVKSRVQSICNSLSLTLVISDSFEINEQSQDFEIGTYYVIDDVGGLTTNDSFEASFISNKFNKSLWFLKDIEKDDNQDQKDVTYNLLIQKINLFMWNFNQGGGKTNLVKTWTTTRGQMTDNYFLAVNLKFQVSTECNR